MDDNIDYTVTRHCSFFLRTNKEDKEAKQMRHIKIIFLFSFNYDNIVLRNVLMINGVHRINFITQNHSQINFLHVQNFY